MSKRPEAIMVSDVDHMYLVGERHGDVVWNHLHIVVATRTTRTLLDGTEDMVAVSTYDCRLTEDDYACLQVAVGCTTPLREGNTMKLDGITIKDEHFKTKIGDVIMDADGGCVFVIDTKPDRNRIHETYEAWTGSGIRVSPAYVGR